MTVHIAHACARRDTPWTQSRARVAQLLCVLVISVGVWSSPLYAQLNMGISEGEDQVSVARLRSALWLAPGVRGGSLQFTSGEVNIKARVDALPIIELGGDLWGTESYGLMFRAELGLGSELDIPILNDGQTLSFNQSHALFGGRYRWHFSESERAPALDLGLGLRWHTEDVPPQRPTYFVDRMTLGPALLLGFQLPISERLSSAINLAYSRHLLIREDPADSGEPVNSSAISAQAQVSMMFTELLGLVLQGQYLIEQVEFNGFGTRASGVKDGRSERDFWSASVGLKVSIR